jgi:hypothetical protein
MRTEHFIEELDCELTRNECRERGKELGRQHQLLREHKLKAARVKAELSVKQKELEMEIDRLATVVHTGKEKRPVTCQEVADHRRFEISVIRIDNGRTVKTRPMDATERKQSAQGDLFAFQADVKRAADEGARQVHQHDEPEEEEEPMSGQQIFADDADLEESDHNASGSEDDPVPLPNAVDLSPSEEDEASWASSRRS